MFLLHCVFCFIVASCFRFIVFSFCHFYFVVVSCFRFVIFISSWCHVFVSSCFCFVVGSSLFPRVLFRRGDSHWIKVVSSFNLEKLFPPKFSHMVEQLIQDGEGY